jgi:transcriptional regulator with XRE-family HTH domain
MNLKETIGRNVRGLRGELGLSQSELAAKAGLSRFVIIKIENRKGVTLETLGKIAEACNVNASDLMQRDGVAKSIQWHTEFKRDGASVNTDYYDSEFSGLPEYVQHLTKALSVKLSKYFTPDNVRRELYVSKESVIVNILQMMNSPNHNEAVHNLTGKDTTNYWRDAISSLIMRNA